MCNIVAGNIFAAAADLGFFLLPPIFFWFWSLYAFCSPTGVV